MASIRIGIVEDNYFLQKALEEKLALFPDLSCRFIVSNGKELLKTIVGHLQTELLLMDIEMPEMDGIEATERIKEKYPHIRVLVLTDFDSDEKIFNAIKAGADGYLLKDTPAERLYEAIQEVLSGGAPMTPSIARKALQLLRKPMEQASLEEQEKMELSTRETEVLEQLATGKSYTKIAEILVISPATVRKHIENIYKKLQAHNKLEAIQIARKNKLL
ncbi:MAG: response regulator transcription factor [Bacteroidota bacterium]|nr:response regulator transcription factor [Bacteroidota bacterium]